MKNFEKNSQIKEDIKKVNPDVLINRGYAQESPDGNIVCPFCGNGSHDNGTGVSVTQDAYGNWRGHCFACGETFDNLTLIAKHYGYDIKSDFPKVLKEGATLLGSSADFGDFKHNHKASAKNYAKRQQSKKADELPTDHSKFLDSAFLNLEDLPENVRRGLDLATLIHFNNGFDSAWQHPDSPKMPKTPRWIIPTSKHHYLARAISDDVKKEFRKIHTGSKEIFNIDALQENCTVLVVEGEIDVMSIWQATKGLVPCVAVSGCTGYNLLLKWLEKNPDCNCSFIVVFDNDSGEKNSGQNAATKFVDELTKKGVPAVNKILSFKKDFDANDWLMEDPDALRDRIFEIYDEGSAELETIYDKVLAEKAFNKKVADFELANGEINPAVLPEVKSAIETLDSLTEKNFDGNLLNDESFRRQLGLCSFYNFAANSLSKFWSAFNKKRKLANAKVKTDFELDDDEHVIRNFSENDIRKLMKKYAKLVESQHNDFNKEQQRKRREEYRQQKQAEEEQLHADIWEQLNFLKSQPQTVERDKEIRRLILELCDWLKDKNGERLVPKSTVGNFRLIFNLEPLIDGLFGKNDFTGATVFTKEPFWTVKNATSRIGEPFKKEDFDVFANFVSDTYKDIACKVNFNRQISEYAVAHTFHPIKDYFDSLPKWDGTARAEKLFVDYLGVDDSPYTREVTMNFFTAAIARIYHPGCEYQYVPIFQGNQGVGKGFVIKTLVDRVYDSAYLELRQKLHDSHAVDAIRNGWFVEMPELTSMKGVSLADIKAFVSAREDTNRFAYDKETTTYKRHNVFFGTTNDKFPLKDKTGNRRFLPLRSNLAENQYVEGLTDDYVDQFWAEVFFKYNELFKNGFDSSKLILSKESIITAAELSKEFTEDDGLIGEILAFLDIPVPHKAIRRLLSREERKYFFANGGSITLIKRDLLARQAVRRRPEEMTELKEVLALADDDDYQQIQRNEDDSVTFYGAEYRDSICPSEVLNEYFAAFDRRVSIVKIAEILATELPKLGWSKTRRKTSIYGDQRNTFIRDFVTDDTEQVESAADEQLATSTENIPDTENVKSTDNTSEINEPEVDNHSEEQTTEDFDSHDDEFVTVTSSADYGNDYKEEFLTDEEMRDFYDE